MEQRNSLENVIPILQKLKINENKFFSIYGDSAAIISQDIIQDWGIRKYSEIIPKGCTDLGFSEFDPQPSQLWKLNTELKKRDINSFVVNIFFNGIDIHYRYSGRFTFFSSAESVARLQNSGIVKGKNYVIATTVLPLASKLVSDVIDLADYHVTICSDPKNGILDQAFNLQDDIQMFLDLHAQNFIDSASSQLDHLMNVTHNDLENQPTDCMVNYLSLIHI